MTKLKHIAATLGIYTLGLTAAMAQGEITDRLSAAEIINRVTASNPGIAALRSAGRAEVASLRADNALAAPEAEFEYLRGRGGDTRWNTGISQTLTMPSVYGSRRRVATATSAALQQKVAARQLEVKVAVARLLCARNYALARAAVVDSVLADMDGLCGALDRGLEHGLVTILDQRKARLETAQLRIDRTDIEAEIRRTEADIEALSGSAIVWNNNPTPLLLPNLCASDSLLTAAGELDPAVRAAEAEMKLAEANRVAAKATLLPEVTLGYRHAYEERTHYNGFALGITLPAWGASTRTQAARLGFEAAQTARQAALTEAVTRTAGEIRQARCLRRRLEALRADGLGDDYPRLLRRAYSGGELSVVDYLRELAYWRTVRLGVIALEAQYADLLVSLNRYAL